MKNMIIRGRKFKKAVKRWVLIIFDTTLRDGEQCPGAAMNWREKLEVARQLVRLKVSVIEAGFPCISEDDFKAVRTIAKRAKGPIIAALARCILADIDAAAEALTPAGKRARIHVFIGTSPLHRANLGKTQAEVLEMAIAGVKRAKSYVRGVEFSPMDATRTEPDFLMTVCKAAIVAGATVINIPDTVGYTMPEEFGALIRKLYDAIPEFQSGKAIISVHCHDDLGLAAANSLAAIRAGAQQVECTINGIGERAGNAALEEIVMALKTRRDLFPYCVCDVNTQELLKTSRLVSRMCGLVVQRNKAVVGENAFAHSSGIHQDGVLKRPNSFEVMKPRNVGWDGESMPLSKHSGRAALKKRLERLGFHLTDSEVAAIFGRFKEIGDKKKFVYDDDLSALVEGRLAEVPETWSLEHLQISSGTGQIPTAVVRLKNCTETQEDTGIGDGPVDATLKAVDRLTGTRGRLLDYSVRSVSQGKDALGEVTVKVDFGQGKVVVGRGASTDVIEASALAYLNAVNRCLLINGNGKKKGK